MLRMTISKIKKACAVAFLPKILQGDPRAAQRKLTKRTYEALSRARKSTESSNDEEYERKMRIIEKCFAPKTIEPECKSMTPFEACEERLKYEAHNKKCQKITAQSLEHSINITLDEVRVQTTAKEAEEKLIQKIERIDEHPVIEAVLPNADGINIPPKILREQTESLHFSQYKKTNSEHREIDYDALAKRCLGTPIDEVDEKLIKELRKLSDLTSSEESHNSIPLASLRNQCIEKYLSDRSNEIRNIPSNEIFLEEGINKLLKAERIQPLHSDTAYLCVNDMSKDFTETRTLCSINEISTEKDSEKTLELPTNINPYDSPTFPFYEYNIKESSKDIPNPVIIETINETNLNKTVDEEITSERTEEQLKGSSDMGALGQPEISSTQGNPKYSQILGETKQLFVTKTDNPSDWYPQFQGRGNNQSETASNTPNTAISGTFPKPAKDSQGGEQPNTAISAHQELNEFHGITLSETVYSTEFSHSETKPIKPYVLESPLTQSMSSAKLDTAETQRDNTYHYNFPVSHILFETQLKPVDLKPNITETTSEAQVIPNENLSITVSPQEMDVPLSEMLKRVRERNHFAFCQDYVIKIKEVNMSKEPCLPPLAPPKSNDSLGPPPCQPKPKPRSDSKSPPPCRPKKDPCAKFTSAVFGAIINHTYCLVFNEFYYFTNCRSPIYDARRTLTTYAFFTNDGLLRNPQFGTNLTHKQSFENNKDFVRDFEPWTPIPSWPSPKKEEKRPFVCRKDGCKLIPPPNFHAPCNENPCQGVPKKTFSPSIFLPLPLVV